jgi:hypothetical protein
VLKKSMRLLRISATVSPGKYCGVPPAAAHRHDQLDRIQEELALSLGVPQ